MVPERWLRNCASFPVPGSAGPDETRVWTIGLDLPPDQARAAEALLSSDERERAQRFHFEKDRRRFTASRGTLRTILGDVLGIGPEAVRFRYGSHGKPALDGTPGRSLHFNLSHSEALALVAVSEQRDVGVDVEYVRPVPELEGIVKGFFSAREQSAILDDEHAREEAFFYHWTLKEAWLKGIGIGLSGPLTGLEVSRGSDGAPRLRRVDAARGEDHLPWHLVSWTPAPGFMAALAVGGVQSATARTGAARHGA